MEFEGPVTILFTDVEGSTQLRTRLGDVASHQLLRGHEDVIRTRIAEFDGREIKALGDGFMVAFTSARKAVACAVAIQRALAEEAYTSADGGVKIRIGLNTGEVIAEDGDLHGEAVAAAARIAARAEGGQVLAAGVVKEIAGTVPGATFVDRGAVKLKGFQERKKIFEILWDRPEDDRLGARTPYVGREAERAELRRHVEAAVGGRGTLVLIGGEPGVGKTRLAEEIAAEGAARGMLALTGHCYETEAAPPYIPFVEIIEQAARGAARSEALREALGDLAGEVARIVPELKRLFPDIPAPIDLPPEQERRYLFNTIQQFLARAAAIRPQLIVLDDLQWADESTMLLIEHLAERLVEMPVLIVGTYRDVELDVARPLANSLAQLLRRHLAHRIVLKRFSEEGVTQLLTVLGGAEPPPNLVKILYEETEGNPFFVEEVFKYLSEEGKLFDEHGGWRRHIEIAEVDVPEGVRLVIGRRLERLAPSTIDVLSAAAVVGRGFSYRMLEAMGVVGSNELLNAIDEAERVHLVSSSALTAEDSYSFAHELIRQTLLARLSSSQRRRLHLSTASAIEKLNATRLDEHAADVAYHLEQAGPLADGARTAGFLKLAGKRALDASAYEDAVRFLDDALSLLPEDAEERADILTTLGLAQRSLNRVDESAETLRSALAAYTAAGRRSEAARLCMDIANVYAWASDWTRALEVAAQALEYAGSEPTQDRARLLGLSGILMAFAGQRDVARSLLDEGKEIIAPLHDPVLEGYAQIADGLWHYAFMDMEEAVEKSRAGMDALREGGVLWDLASFMGFFGFALFFMGRWEEAGKMALELEALASRIGHTGAYVFSLRGRPRAAFIEGDLDELEEFVANDLELSRTVGPLHVAQSLVWKALLHFRRGEWEEAERTVEEAAATEAPGFWGQIQWSYVLLFKAYLGKTDEAMALFEEGRANLPQIGQPLHFGQWSILGAAIEGLAVLDELEEVASLYDTWMDMDRTSMFCRPFDLRLVATLKGIAAAGAGRWEEADGFFDEALASATERNIGFEIPDIHRWRAWMLIHRAEPGDRERARGLLDEAIAGYRLKGETGLIQIAERLRSTAR